MNAWFRKLILEAAVVAAASAGNALAAPREVEAFDVQTWRALQASLDAPAAVVFTTTDCAYCPATIRRFAKEIQQRKLQATLIAVVMDVAPGDTDAQLLGDAHYQPAHRLLAFAGPPVKLRYAVDPTWRGVTPFVALLKPGERPVLLTGPPSAQILQQWAAPNGRTKPAR